MLTMNIDNTPVQVEWEANEATKALAQIAREKPLVISMSRYGGFEQVGSIGHRLPAKDRQTTTRPGDIVLYCADQLVIFYGSNSWSYTRLGRMTGVSREDLTSLLGRGDVTVTIQEQG